MFKTLLSLFDVDESTIKNVVSDTLKPADDGELFLEYSQYETLKFDNGYIKEGNFWTEQGFGLRVVAHEAVGYGYSNEMSLAALKRVAKIAGKAIDGYTCTYASAPQQKKNHNLYSNENPIGIPSFKEKAQLLSKIDTYLRSKDERVKQVTVSLDASWKIIEILRADHFRIYDTRPMTRIAISVVVGTENRQESGYCGKGGRVGFTEFIHNESWKKEAEEALRQALVNLEAIDAPAGTMDVVLASGWPGVMLHEAVGHGLEGDFNRKESSVFSNLMGEIVASPNVTVVDDGTISKKRGSLNFDDEGTPSSYNVLIEKGKLVNFMQDRQNARLMNMKPTGNGRRESYASPPMPRMTNTYMLSGDKHPQEIIASVKKGIYAVTFGGGQVDITSGQFVFNCTEAYLIEEGKIGAPIKGAMLIGNGPEAMKRLSMIGNDSELDPGIGQCGKNGQWVPVGVGQPHLRMDQVTVGGTKT
ncbi:TldD protein [Liberibacter crescens BT-1]|uniref:TldD protein n=1 Tax=Liberibacter crescens (strain BT-1) TaxID=1215343 RepID=L0EU75_LIBCB|nr:metalloprotease TldD [Liberibacter crescens]AGA64213.1 TldD protein [Liberibacter crescens BT-1]AMC12463.1 protease TldD [Liberibacter crescens]